MTTRWCVIALVLVAGCSKSKTEDKAGDKAGAKPAETDKAAAELAAKPREAVTVPAMKVTLDVPAGTTVTPESRPEDATRNANLKNGDFMVNVFAVDEYSTPSFAKAKEVYKDDKLVEWYLSEETPTGWITFKQVISAIANGPRFEVDVRTKVGDRPLDCGISAKTKGLAELALKACKTLR